MSKLEKIRVEKEVIKDLYDLFYKRIGKNTVIFLYERFFNIKDIYLTKKNIDSKNFDYSYIGYRINSGIVEESLMYKFINIDRVRITSVFYDKEENGLMVNIAPIEYKVLELSDKDIEVNREVIYKNTFDYDRQDDVIISLNKPYKFRYDKDKYVYVYTEYNSIYSYYIIRIDNKLYRLHNYGLSPRIEDVRFKDYYELLSEYFRDDILLSKSIKYISKLITDNYEDVSNTLLNTEFHHYTKHKLSNKYTKPYNYLEIELNYPSIPFIMKSKYDGDVLELVYQSIRDNIEELNNFVDFIYEDTDIYTKYNGKFDNSIWQYSPENIKNIKDMESLIDEGNNILDELDIYFDKRDGIEISI